MLTAAILAGGLATRLRPLTETIPKSLVEINGEPFISHQLRLLQSRGIERVVLCVAHLGGMVEAFAGDGGAFGTGGAIRNALPLLGEAFFTIYGDSYLTCDYRAVEQCFLASGKSGLMTVYRNENLWDASNVEFREGRVHVYDKRARTPEMRHIDYGLGAFRRNVFEQWPAGPFDLADVYRALLDRDDLAAFEVPERFYETGSFAGIQELSRVLA